MDKLRKSIKLLYILILVLIVLTDAKVNAKTITINSVELNTAKNGYEILLNTNDKTNIQKKVISNNKIVINLKNTVANPNINTIYKSSENIKHLLLKPQMDNLQIEISGNNVANSELFLNNQPVQKTPDNNLLKMLMLLSGLVFIGGMIKTKNSKKKVFSVNISKKNEIIEDKILKVEFERRTGLIARGTTSGSKSNVRTISQYNVRKVEFENDYANNLKVKI